MKNNNSTCIWPDCNETKIKCKGMCNKHSQRSRKLGHPDKPWEIWDAKTKKPTCHWPDCDRETYGHGFCVRDYTRAKRLGFPDSPWIEWELKQFKPRTDGMKTCSNCKQDKPLDEFYNEAGRYDGKNNYCINCSTIRGVIYRKENKEVIAERDRRYYAEKPWVKIAIEQSRRANESGVRDEKVSILILRKRDGDDCALCGQIMDFMTKKRGGNKATHEHIVAIKAGGDNTYDNSVLVCDECNSSKGVKSLPDYIGFCELIGKTLVLNDRLTSWLGA